MKNVKYLLLSMLAAALAACSQPVDNKVDKYAIDCTQMRGFNYTPAGVAEPRHHIDTWVKYDEDVIAYDLDLAKGLDLNFCRIFVPYQVYTEIGDTLVDRLRDFAHKCDERGMKMMPVVGSGRWTRDSTLLYQAEEWVDFLVGALKDEPNLAMWDIMNEPDLNVRMREANFENCRRMYGLFKEKDPDTPLTIGFQLVSSMIKMADYADILQFHDYSETRAEVRDTVARAQAFADQVGKKIFNGEMGCVGRANPYDVTLEEHMKANMGWCIWELMVVRKGWGMIHGVFYEDGTVRDPSIPAAILGYFRNREDIVPEDPDREGRITNAMNGIEQWKKDGAKDWEKGLRLAELSANTLEAAQLAPMREAPNWQVNQLRKSGDLKEMKEVLDRFYVMMKPYKRPARK
ncbi:MAG: cellulase family glycosylhydrolase [Bacteroidales bacterium]|nr:cellulase family glycosylhydrolase [Bacteroidales bacterium]